MNKMVNLWVAEWHSRNRLDGDTRHIIYDDNCLPDLFRTRKVCREFIKNKYGYIAERKDLRQEPHGWRMPQARKAIVTLC
jgi:hypothetical protein